VELTQYHIYLVNLDPTVGHEIRKTRPCLIVSPDEMNRHLKTIMIAPLTSKSHDYPTRVAIRLDGKDAWVVLDQMRTVDRSRLINKLGKIDRRAIHKVKEIIKEMLVD